MKARLLSISGGIFSLFLAAGLFASTDFPNALQAVNYSILPENKTQLDLVMADVVGKEPRSFTLDNPPRIVLDFPKTGSNIGKQRQVIGLGAVNDVLVMEAGGRTRAIISLNYASSYDISVSGKHIYVILTEGDDNGAAPVVQTTSVAATPSSTARVQTAVDTRQKTAPRQTSVPQSNTEKTLSDFDFRKIENGDGRVIVSLSDPHTPADIHKEGDRLIIDFIGAVVPSRLDRRFDVVDFSTKVQSVDIFQEGKNARMVITTQGLYQHSVFQAGNQLSVDIRGLEGEAAHKYKGKAISLNIQDISVRTVLQIISDEMERNVIISDNVKGGLALRLDNVPVDQALEVILKTQGLSVQLIGDVMFVGPSGDIVNREKEALQADQDIAELSPLKNVLIQINYAKVDDIVSFIESENSSLLSARGSVTSDKRTNTLLVRDTVARIKSLRELINKLDIPVRQVLIEARIVIANQTFGKELGVRFGLTGISEPSSDSVLMTTGGTGGTDTMVSSALGNLQVSNSPFPVALPGVEERLNVNLPVAAAGKIAFALLGPDYLLDLELSAMQAEGTGEVVSTPRIITIDQHKAEIRQGVEIGFQEASSSGATSVSFKEAVLKLEVTPQITPDDSLMLDLVVSKDSVGDIIAGIPSINTREVKTRVLVRNGETVVLGGIFEESSNDSMTKVPLLGDIPGVGWLFRSKIKRTNKAELLIFVTPKILKESLGAGLK